MSPLGIRVKPGILVSINGLAPGFCLHFQQPENLIDGEVYRVQGWRGIATTSRTLYSHANG